MLTNDDKHDDLAAVDAKEQRDVESSSTIDTEDEDGVVTLKTKLAVLSLILMYESYLFTLLM